MSSRTRSDFGTLGQRVTRTPATRHVEVLHGEQWCAGLLVDWIRVGELWAAQVAWVDDGLRSAIVPAGRVRPCASVQAHISSSPSSDQPSPGVSTDTTWGRRST